VIVSFGNGLKQIDYLKNKKDHFELRKFTYQVVTGPQGITGPTLYSKNKASAITVFNLRVRYGY